MSNDVARGGTELMLGRLQESLPELCDKVQIICSRPELVPHEDKPRILWLHDLPQDPASQCLRDPSYRTKFNRIVFVSHWQQQMYNVFLGIPYNEGTVIKNAVPTIEAEFPKPKLDGKLRFIYTSTPHRGLGLLSAAAKVLAEQRQDWQLDVYSSFKLYGPERAAQDEQYEPLYDELRANPCVVYHGTAPENEVREAVSAAHVFVYPSVYPETSCLAAIEAMMAGCLTITTNFGALIETCGEWAWMMQWTENYNILAQMTLDNMLRAFEVYDREETQNLLQVQMGYYQNFFSWHTRVPAWKRLLEYAVKQGTPDEKLILG